MSAPSSENLIFERRIKGHLPITRFAITDAGEVTVVVPDGHQPRLYHIVRIAIDGEWAEIGRFSVEKLQNMDFSRDAGAFVAITDDDVYVFREGSKSRFFADRRDNYAAISMSASGDLFVTGSADMIRSSYSVTLAKTSGGQEWVRDVPFSVACARISADASRILIGAEEGLALMMDVSRSDVWQLEGGDPITALAVSDSGDRAVIGARTGSVRAVGDCGNILWEVAREGRIADCAMSGDGKLIAVSRETSSGGAVECFCDDGMPILEHQAASKVLSVSCSAGGGFVAISCADGMLQVLEIRREAVKALASEAANAVRDEGLSALKKGDHAAAVEKLTRYLEIRQGDADACRALVEAQDALIGERIAGARLPASGLGLEDVVSELRSALEIRPFDTGLRAKVSSVFAEIISKALAGAGALARDGSPEQALAAVGEVVRLDPTNVAARELLGRLEAGFAAKCLADADAAIEKADSAEAVRLLELAAGALPTPEIGERLARARAKHAFDEGMALYDAKKFAQAVFQFRKALSAEPGNAEARKYLEYSENLRQDDMIFDRFSKLE